MIVNYDCLRCLIEDKTLLCSQTEDFVLRLERSAEHHRLFLLRLVVVLNRCRHVSQSSPHAVRVTISFEVFLAHLNPERFSVHIAVLFR